jgi:hypothetical protein
MDEVFIGQILIDKCLKWIRFPISRENHKNGASSFPVRNTVQEGSGPVNANVRRRQIISGHPSEFLQLLQEFDRKFCFARKLWEESRSTLKILCHRFSQSMLHCNSDKFNKLVTADRGYRGPKRRSNVAADGRIETV